LQQTSEQKNKSPMVVLRYRTPSISSSKSFEQELQGLCILGRDRRTSV